MPAYAIRPVTSDGSFHLRYVGDVGVTLPDGPQLIAVNLVRSSGSQALTRHCLVDTRRLSDLPSGKEHFVSSGRQILPLVGEENREPGDIFAVAHAPLMWVPLDILQYDSRTPGLYSGRLAVTPIFSGTTSPLAAAAATTSPSPALFKRLTPEQSASFLRVWGRLPSHLRAVAIDLHGPVWTPLAIEQLDDVLCNFADVFSKSKTDFGSCSLCLSRFRSRKVARLSLPGPTASTLLWPRKLPLP